MIRKTSRRLLASLFSPVTALRGAAAGSVGLFIGLLPLYDFRFVAILLISALFRLNLPAIVLGMSITFLFPFLHLFSFLTGQHLGSYMNFHGRSHFLGNTITGIVLALLSFPLFLLIFNLPLAQNLGKRDYVFQDENKRRWLLTKRLFIAFVSFTILILAVFGVSIGVNPFLPQLSLNSDRNLLHRLSPIAEKLSESTLEHQLRQEDKEHPTFQLDYRRHHRVTEVAQPHEEEVYGFYVNWDDKSKESLLQNDKSLTTLLPEWYFLKKDLTINDQTDSDVVQIAKARNLKIEPILSNYVNNKWDGALVHQLLADPDKVKQLTQLLYNQVESQGEAGINIDFENIDKQDQDLLTAFITVLSNTFHAHGLQVTEDVPADDNAFDYGALAKVADRLIVMMYDEHSGDGPAGPVASQNWFEQTLDQLDIPPDKIIVSMGNYGYDWVENDHQPAEAVTFGDIMDMAQQSHLIMQWDDESGNPYMRYKDNNDSHIVWFLDAATLYNQIKVVRDNDFKGVAVWRLGSEDPSIWKLLNHPAAKVNEISEVNSLESVRYLGAGEILRITSAASVGKRTLTTDENGIADESYLTYPLPYVVERYGKPKGKQVVLTFDDGPSGQYTPQILQILKRYGIKASFFVVGENAEMHPELIQQLYKEGHELGNHTFTHPDVAAISLFQTRMELNATQRLIQEITGHSMTFFRPPYVADAEPSTPAELLPILRGQEMGYTMVGELIDPEDWAKPPADEIVRRVMDRLPQGNVILLHDAGGNREQTVKALPKIIEQIKSKGYTFTTLSQLIGKTRGETMPVVSASDSPLLVYDRAVFNALMDWSTLLQILLGTAIAIGVIRVACLALLAWRHKKSYRPADPQDNFKPPVSVVLAAYNEEKVIVQTVRSILQSDYPNLEIVIVDDGSTDQTKEVIREAFGDRKDVRLITKSNGGKASAVNMGFKVSQGDFIVALDADTLIAPDAISLLIRHFRDDNMAAVSGNVKVGNVRNILTSWQHIEYVTGFNLERRAFDRLNCITVVPGAIGAWRKTMIEQAGYYKEDTLAEDTDLTLSLLRLGFTIGYEERAYAYTEAPDDVRSFIKQRYRWTYGTLQCLWKHRKALLNPKHKTLGYIGLPNMWLFQYVYQTISPIIDILFVCSLFTSSAGKACGYYAGFFLLDLLVAIFAFRLEKVSLKPLASLFLQRIVYRQFMTYVIIKSLLAAVKGMAVGWNKLKRKGNMDIEAQGGNKTSSL
ncbi:cellulose synthase/poly-beta-1,6-N-acetylglucosamine synthase-like glycosyltransferase/spore germination protein YaaH/peptidoglycan/xylan/chitin deacetylase (PgdA/CDA1 family) [Paenibacillus baekrokdamisoli]|uniref:DUF2062 domain-containing protein n=1 Tax=Paenibacillus baekrokdamisoli TaxID=1712516 RepID=UPI00181585F5|nr:DUF2062 domain-containing protein [Paenibacillus baekrokdamisoli]MBB3068162.1 cellulose synthase/poly-beta-1,6-N-acetylglucosamine synthase-like glycosyltransferase/spore germination protein YaaH/peptidoglycan/xylan/chitin deacetylase (PgdA/CDA1 family) [Paenibacillus baekrokdamisoli]